MNIFVLDRNPILAARSLDDVRLERLCFECLEMLSMRFELLYGIHNIFPYREKHLDHPVSVWIRKDNDNFNWALAYGVSLCNEYYYRFNYYNKYANTYRKILSYRKVNVPVNIDLEYRNSTIKYKHVKDIVTAYRLHYAWKLKHSDIYTPKKWTKRDAPIWLKELCGDLFNPYTKYILEK